MKGAPIGWCVLFVLAFGGASRARAWCQLRDGNERSGVGGCERDGQPLAWRQRCLTYSVDVRSGAGFSLEDAQRISRAAFDNWSELSCDDGRPFPFVIREEAARECNLAQFVRGGPNINTIAFPERWDFDPGAFAITTVWGNAEGEILDADILVNPAQGPYAECPDEGCAAVEGVVPSDLESVLTHEVGHFFGLAHSQFTSATMHRSAARGEVVKRSVSADDLEGVCTIYPDGPPTCDDVSFAPRGGLAERCEARDEGCSAGGKQRPWLLLFLLGLALRVRSSRSPLTPREAPRD